MKVLGSFGTISILLLSIVPPMFSSAEPPAKEPAQSDNAAPANPKPPFTISKETTYLSEPLKDNGRVDYVAALNGIFSEGVTPENNSVVLLLQAMGPGIIGSNHEETNYRMLGMVPLPKKGDYLIPYEKFRGESTEENEKAEEAEAARDQTQPQEEIEKFYKTMSAPWTAGKYPRYAAWLKANQKPLEKIREACNRPKYYAPMISGDTDNASMIAVLLWVAQESRVCARLLMAHAMYSIGEGNIEEAKRDILACHRLARLEGQGGTIVEALVAIAIDGMACSGDVAIAQSGKLTPRDAAAFQGELRKLPPMPKMADKIGVTERLMFLDCVQMTATKGIDSILAIAGANNQSKDSLWMSFLKSKLPSAFDWDAVLRRGNAWYDRMVEASRKDTYAERVEAWKTLEDEVKQLSQDVKSLKSVKDSLMAGQSLRDISSKKMGDVLLSLLTPALSAVIRAEQRSKVNSDLSQIALALAAYRSEKGNYPDRLADLVPKHLAEMPKDRFTDADYIYRHEENGYLLYSIGPNAKDDGGADRDKDPACDDIAIRTPQEAK